MWWMLLQPSNRRLGSLDSRFEADAITVDARKVRICKLCSKTQCADSLALHAPQLVCKENTRKLSLRRTKCGISGSSSSSTEERKPCDQEEELKRLRAKVELLRKPQRWSKGPETQGEQI